MFQMKKPDKAPKKKKKTNKVEPGNLPEKIQNNDSENDPGSQKKNGEDIRNVYQRPGRTKEQTEMSNTLKESVTDLLRQKNV